MANQIMNQVFISEVHNSGRFLVCLKEMHQAFVLKDYPDMGFFILE